MIRAFAKYLGPVAYGISIPLFVATIVTGDQDLGRLGAFCLGSGAAWYLGRLAEKNDYRERIRGWR